LVAIVALAAAGIWLKKRMGTPSGSGDSSQFVEDSIEVDVPVSTAYNQWTQFEEFPNFMHDVLEVRQIDDTHLHWRARIAGKEEEWDAEITNQIPDRRIAWRSTSGPPNSGAVTFDRLSENRTRITLRMSYQPRNALEKIGDALGAVKLETSSNLHRFAEFLQSRGRETGAWRGTVSGGATVSNGAGGAAGGGSSGGSDREMAGSGMSSGMAGGGMPGGGRGL
jgi:uncharacterized membrane protein